MKKILLAVVVLVLVISGIVMALPATPNPTTISWTAPTLNTDGTPLTDLAGYKIYYGTATGVYGTPKDVGNVMTYPISSVVTTKGTYFLVVTAYNTAGDESDYSNELSFRLKSIPAKPTGVKVQ